MRERDYMVRATAAEGRIRAFAVVTSRMVSEMQKTHDTSPNVTAALGRLLTGASMMGAMMKDEEDRLTLSIRSQGPIQGMTVSADNQGHVKGFPNVNQVPLKEKYAGKLDVGSSVGPGTLTVIRDEGLKEPYSSQIRLVSGEIAEDLTYYFAVSEQVPSSVGLGVLVDTDWSVKDAGGFIIQLMPDALDSDIDRLEARLKEIHSITQMLEKGMEPEDILEHILGDMGLEILSEMPVAYRCDCSRERIERALLSISRSDLQEMIDDGKPVELKCQFCNKAYRFTPEELKALINQ
ncbi:MAG: Hsp33 family molecular chaperone HslO [Lachnospiraceae bacterium]|jgi:molecular chaperone Hsp33|nr:Hsp33 family molecular chaperone HslO [Lachnospiraceae bacterium]